MSLNVRIEEFFRATPEEVWSQIADAEALGQWLMPNDFQPQVGATFTLFPDHPTPWEGNVECEVLELSPPRRMVWSWRTAEMDAPTQVVFDLIAFERGTRLIFRHSGETDTAVEDGLANGWPKMLIRFRRRLEGRG